MAAFLPILAAAALYGLSSQNRDVVYTKATVDGRSYLVLRRKDSAAAANLLAMIRRDLESLVAHVAQMDPSDEDFARLAKKFNPDAISEGSPGSGYTSYTVDKASVVMCIRQSSGEFVPKNVIVYVAVHELAHIMTSTVGHTPEFWANNARLLDAAKQIGVYESQDFSKAPQPYCGMHIGS
jgi:hypothetical protein